MERGEARPCRQNTDTRRLTEDDGDEHGFCRRCWKVHKVPPNPGKNLGSKPESGAAFREPMLSD